MKKIIFLLLISLLVLSCKDNKKGAADNIIDIHEQKEIVQHTENNIPSEITIPSFNISPDQEFNSTDHYGYIYDAVSPIYESMRLRLFPNARRSSVETDDILSVHYYRDRSNRNSYRLSRPLYSQALEFYNENDLDQAIEMVIQALQICPVSVYYYHYGVFLMEKEDYENAEKAFFNAIKYFYDGYFSNPFRDYYYSEEERGSNVKNDLYTFDRNGAPREVYFTLYNLACIYSITMELELSLEFLIQAIERGYPYIDHLLNDTDLSNLFTENAEAKNIINDKYKKGLENTVAGKVFGFGQASDSWILSFEDECNVKIYYPGSDMQQSTSHGKYMVRNYNIIMHFYEHTGNRGYGNTTSAGVRTHFDNYGPMETIELNNLYMILIPSLYSGGAYEEIEKKDSYWYF